MKNTFTAEWIRLSAKRTWLIAIPLTIVYSAILTVVMIDQAPPRAAGGVSLQALGQSGGATLAVRAAVSFTSVLILALFVGMSAGSFTRGTWRASLLQQPRRVVLAAGTFAARIAVGAVVVAVLFLAGIVTAYAMAPGKGIDTGAWLDLASWRMAAEDYLRTMCFVVGWGVFGTMIGTVTRSVPIGLGAGIVWAGPLENILGDRLSFGGQWFPGLLLRYVVAPETAVVTGITLVLRLALYAVVALVLVAVLLQRRDVTS
ncbi:hypothetical protein [Flexivirga caeni]|uniref:ABC transporter permease n=1 Tax=Flexivirga caeni TaxID=2294115 RepID=A0A3M9M7A2_9MICO|nr:hypothetical protein [Flexivirga caeni]RNI21411.1 hypothetical protein EFY87_12155 [Flexivirga caeni]